MKIICAWCKKDKGDKPPYSDKSISYGICKECAEKLRRKANCSCCSGSRKVIVDNEKEICPVCE